MLTRIGDNLMDDFVHYDHISFGGGFKIGLLYHCEIRQNWYTPKNNTFTVLYIRNVSKSYLVSIPNKIPFHAMCHKFH